MERHETTARSSASGRAGLRSRQARLLLAGIACMVGGEGFCIFGPLSYPRLVHVTCHAIFYAGVVLCAGAAVLHWGVKARKLP